MKSFSAYVLEADFCSSYSYKSCDRYEKLYRSNKRMTKKQCEDNCDSVLRWR
jgi:hypothetical protein